MNISKAENTFTINISYWHFYRAAQLIRISIRESYYSLKKFLFGFRFVDFNECAGKRHACDTEATCYNNHLSYICECNKGYNGNGIFCKKAEKRKFKKKLDKVLIQDVYKCLNLVIVVYEHEQSLLCVS